jgi:hypothetical protein
MPSIIVVEKLGNVKQVNIKTVVETELYKKAGLKTPDGFKCYTNWSVEYSKAKYTISLYGKTTGRANCENKYEFPPPVDNTLFFGNCILTAKTPEGSFIDLHQDMWEKIYEDLYGGFEDIGEEDSSSECESDDEEEVSACKRTKNGYVKDGFVVEDGDVDEDEDEEEEGDDDEEDVVYVKQNKKTVKAKKTGSAKIKNAFELKDVEEENYLDCTSELSEEAYFV